MDITKEFEVQTYSNFLLQKGIFHFKLAALIVKLPKTLTLFFETYELTLEVDIISNQAR